MLYLCRRPVFPACQKTLASSTLLDGVGMRRFPVRLRWPGSDTALKIRCAAIVIILIEVGLFAVSHRHTAPGTRTGEGLTIWGDGLGYYAWLRSPLVDHDWSFANEFEEHNPWRHWVPPAHATTELGYRPNPFSIGPACCWA